MRSGTWYYINTGVNGGYNIPGFEGGKTGYTNPAGQCLATWAENADGEMFVSVIAGSTALKPLDAMGDTLTLYQLTCEPLDRIERITLDEADLPDYVHN